MPITPFLLAKFFSDPKEAMRLLRIASEFENYSVWRMYSALQESQLLRQLQEKPWWEFPDKDLARNLGDIFVYKGYAAWKGDALVFKSSPARPTVSTSEVADLIPVIDKVAQMLPRALLTGEKPSLIEDRAYYSKLLGSAAHKVLTDITIEVTGLPTLSESAVIVDLLPRAGLSTLSLLERTRARIVAVEPLPQNIELIKNLVKLVGQQERVVIVQSSPEAMKLPEKVNAVFASSVMHWVSNPHLVLTRVRENLREDGFLAVYQPCYEGGGLILSLFHYFFGAVRVVPKSSEVQELIRQAGFKITKATGSRGFLALRAEPQ
ncbi:MAG: class I SAM-dependent methyltransferase [Thermofilum sp.]